MTNKTQITRNIFLVLALLTILPFASATIAMVNPSAGTNNSASFTTNWTFVNVTDGITDPLSANSTFYWNGTGSWVAVTKTYFFCLATSCNATLDITSMSDGHGILNFAAGNATKILGGTVSGVFTVDTSAPVVTLTPSPTSQINSGSVTTSWTDTDSVSGIQTVSNTITPPTTLNCQSTATTSSTANSNTVLSGADTACLGTYTISHTATNYAGLSTVTTSSFNIYRLSSGGPVPTNSNSGVGTFAVTGGTNSSPPISKNTTTIVLIIFGIIYLVRKKR